MKICPRLAEFGIFDKDVGSNKAKRIKLCETCPLWDERTQLGYCIYDHPGRISKADEKKLKAVANNLPI